MKKKQIKIMAAYDKKKERAKREILLLLSPATGLCLMSASFLCINIYVF